MLTLPRVSQTSLPIRPFDWTGLPDRFMNPGELECLIALVGLNSPRTVIEFGVNTGRTAKALIRSIPSIRRYIGIDVLPGYVPAMKVQRNEVPSDPGYLAFDEKAFELILRKNGSHDLIPDDLPRCDAVFIDGDHSRAGVMHDTMLARKRINPGGLIVWHDYHDLNTVDVRDVLHEMKQAGADIWHVAGTWLAFERAT